MLIVGRALIGEPTLLSLFRRHFRPGKGHMEPAVEGIDPGEGR
jgi:hypothetical protein